MKIILKYIFYHYHRVTNRLKLVSKTLHFVGHLVGVSKLFHFSIFRSAITAYAVNGAQANVINNPQQERGVT